MKTWHKVRRYPNLGLVILAYIAFIALGLPDGLLGVAWPSIRAGFSIPLDSVGMLLAAAVTGYTTSSFFSGPLTSRLGVGRVLALSCALTGAALIGYTLVPAWLGMVLLGVFAGLGAGAIDAGLNTYVAAHFGAGLMQWLHASYGIGATLGPVIMTVALGTFNSWRLGYRLVGGAQLALCACFVLSLPMWNQKGASGAEDEPRRLTDYRTPMKDTLRHPQAWLSMLLFFLYVGAEASLGTWTYSLLTESRGIAPTTAGLWSGSYWATFTLGRVAAGLFARRTSSHRLVKISLAGALCGALLLVWNPFPAANFLAVVVIGLAIAPIFPAMTSGTSQRVGVQDAANTIGLQMAAAGLAAVAVPGLAGVLARRLSLEVVPVCLAAIFAALFALYQADRRRGV